MATKVVTLKNSNDDTLYPVTDSNAVNINQQKTLAQALDGVIYAEDPTTPANPDAWITSSDINWSTMPGSYSTTEQKTPFTWVNGKPIYKKTVYFSSVSSGDVNSAHGVSDISLVIKHEAFFISGGSYVTIPSLTSTSGGNYFAIWNITQTNVHTFSSIPLQDLYVTLWYTKTTD